MLPLIIGNDGCLEPGQRASSNLHWTLWLCEARIWWRSCQFMPAICSLKLTWPGHHPASFCLWKVCFHRWGWHYGVLGSHREGCPENWSGGTSLAPVLSWHISLVCKQSFPGTREGSKKNTGPSESKERFLIYLKAEVGIHLSRLSGEGLPAGS